MERAERAALYIFLTGIGVAMIAAAGPLAFPDAPRWIWQSVLGVGAVIAILPACFLLYEYRQLARARRVVPLLGMIVSGIIFLGCAAWYFWPFESKLAESALPKTETKTVEATIAVYPAFAPHYYPYRTELGNPKWLPLSTEDGQGRGAYQAVFEHGMAIWTYQIQTSYILTLDDEKWISRSNLSASDEWMRDKEKVRKRLGIRSGREVPQGGVAKWLYKDKKLFQRLGELLWICNLDGNLVFRQDFEHGMILGPFRTRDKNEDGSQTLIFFMDDPHVQNGRFKREASKAPAPDFQPIGWDQHP
jgi:hypothetical protein